MTSITAAVLSAIVPGLGQFYNGQLWKAIGIHVAMWVALVLTCSVILTIIGVPMLIAVWIVAVGDAFVKGDFS